MFKKLLFTVSFVLLFCVISRAEWERAGWQHTTHAVDISASVDSLESLRVFVADSTYRLYKSTNEDSGWTEITDENSHNPSWVSGVFFVTI